MTSVELNIAGDTTGAYDDDTEMSIQMSWWLHAGSTYNGGTFTSNTWASRVQGNRVKSSNSSFFDSTSRTLFITGIQYELGGKATPFEHRSFGEDLMRCQRYLCRWVANAQFANFLVGRSYNTTQGTAVMTVPVSMRALPALTTPIVTGKR